MTETLEIPTDNCTCIIETKYMLAVHCVNREHTGFNDFGEYEYEYLSETYIQLECNNYGHDEIKLFNTKEEAHIFACQNFIDQWSVQEVHFVAERTYHEKPKVQHGSNT